MGHKLERQPEAAVCAASKIFLCLLCSISLSLSLSFSSLSLWRKEKSCLKMCIFLLRQAVSLREGGGRCGSKLAKFYGNSRLFNLNV